MSLIGLDLGSFELKFVELEKGNPSRLTSFGSISSPEVSLFSESEDDANQYADFIKKFFKDESIKQGDVVVALPESKVFSKVVPFPKMDEAGVKKALELSEEKYIPLSPEDSNVGFEILGDSISEDGKMDVFIVATQKRAVDRLLDVLHRAGLHVVGVETEIMAMARSLLDEDDQSTDYASALLNIGAETTDLALVYKKGIRFTRTVSTGGRALTRAISQELGFDMNQAEEYKRSYGMDSSFLEGRVAEVVRPIFDVTVDELKRSVAFFSSRNKNVPVRRLIVAGGTAMLPGVLAHLAGELNLEVELSNCWKKIEVPPDFPDQEIEDSAQSYAVSAGLALKKVG